MRYLVLSDIHANLEALDAVLDAAREIPYERILVLGAHGPCRVHLILSGD